MYGNGVVIGQKDIVVIRKSILKVQLPAPTALFGVVVGPTARGSCVCRIGTTIPSVIGTTLWGSAWLAVQNEYSGALLNINKEKK
jgi:hypothetical protein